MEALGGNPHDGAKGRRQDEGTADQTIRLFGKGHVRAPTAAVIIPAHLFEVKKPEGQKGPWDYYKQIATISAEDAPPSRSEASECPLVKK